LGRSSHDLVAFDEVGKEFVVLDFAINVYLVPSLRVANVLKTFAIVRGPEEGCGTIRQHLAQHVEGRETALVLSHNPVLDPKV